MHIHSMWWCSPQRLPLASGRWKALLWVWLWLWASSGLWAQCGPGGRVLDTEETPLVGANVLVLETQTGTTTDATGRYQLAELPAGRYTVQVSYVGYATVRQTLKVPSGSGVGQCTLHFTLTGQPQLTDELVVTATRATNRTPTTYTTLTRHDLAPRNLGLDAPHLMQWTPSAVVTSDAGAGIGYTGIWIRGVDPTRTNVTINGIPLNDAESQAVFWVNLPDFFSSAEEVQIQRGVGASTHGPGAFGATININTNRVREQAYASLDAGLGSFNTQRASLRFGTGLLGEKFTLDGRFSRISTDGFIDRARADLDGWFLSGAYLGRRSLLRVNAFQGAEVTYQAWYGVPAELADNPATRTTNLAGTEKAGEPYDNEVDDYGQTHLQVLYHFQPNNHWRLNLAGHYTRGAGFFEQYKADQNLLDYGLPTVGDPSGEVVSDLIRRRWLDNDLYGATYALHYTGANQRLQATLGGAYSHYLGNHFGEVIWARQALDSEIRHRYYDNDGRKNDFNTFLKTTYELRPGLDAYLDLQVRAVAYQFVGPDNNGRRLDQSERLLFFNPKAGLQYQPTPHATFYTSVGVAQREPNRNDYVDNPPATRPRPEQLYNLEIGWRRARGPLALELNGYYMYYLDQLAPNGRLNDVGELLRVNIDRSYRLGLEVSANLDLTERWRLQTSTTLSRNRVVAFTEYVDTYDENFNWLGQQAFDRAGTDLAFSPNLLAMAELGYLLPLGPGQSRLETALSAKYVGQRYLDNSADARAVIDPYAFADLRLSYRWSKSSRNTLRFSLLVQNLFNAQYEANGWSYRYLVAGQPALDRGLYPQAGRNVLVGVGIDF